MASEAAKARSDALLSALARLPHAVLLLDEVQILRPLNRRAEALFRDEALTGDLLNARPSHPLANLISNVISQSESEQSRVVAFPSGLHYRVEASARSEKGLGRWLVLLVAPAAPGDWNEALLMQWALTEKEREVVRLMMSGKSTLEMCHELRIAENTVRSHLKQILAKSNSRTRVEFLAKLLKSR